MHTDTILILDFGSQYTQLIARRIRELNVYCEIHPFNHFPAIGSHIKGVVLSGSPFSVRDPESPRPDLSQIKGKLPVLAVCYGAQLLAHLEGGSVTPSKIREYGRAKLDYVNQQSSLFKGMSSSSQVWMSHGDTITTLPENFEVIAGTCDVSIAGFQIKNEKTYAIQFHPEVTHSTEGAQLLSNFVVDICGCRQEWTPASFIDSTIALLKEKIGNDKVVLGLSGGVDSSVAAVLLHKAIGNNLYCVFVDNGLLRKNEFEQVLEGYKALKLNVKGVNAKDRFYTELKGISDPEKKRKIIGRVFIEVFDEE
ncbi:MAG: glutamine-hydrolyzing GMP synthase, partial [Bacteroidia bacterium]|nr:glutamine-hydrolyzing GMP synthase [Bacteroidia bacterium]